VIAGTGNEEVVVAVAAVVEDLGDLLIGCNSHVVLPRFEWQRCERDLSDYLTNRKCESASLQSGHELAWTLETLFLLQWEHRQVLRGDLSLTLQQVDDVMQRLRHLPSFTFFSVFLLAVVLTE